MPRIKLEGVAQPFGAISKGIKSGVATVHSGVVTGVAAVATTGAAVATTGATAVNSGLNTGFTGVFSLGKGFRDFILRGTVVELAVAVVLGSAFTSLIESLTKDFITPLIAAIFAGSNFSELYFQINSSQFKYGDFINAFITFLFVIAALYFCVVVPLEKLQFAAFKHKAIMRDCPFCLEEISMAATRCKHCCGEVPLTEEMQRTLELATAALDAEEARHQQKWYRRMFAPCTRCCCKPKTAVVQESGDGAVQMQPLSEKEQEVVLVSPLRHSMSGAGSSGVLQRGGSQQGSAYVSPAQSFTGSAPVSTTIDIEQLEQLQHKGR